MANVCPRCSGTGSIKKVHRDCKGQGCGGCNGGTIWEDCSLCNGTGEV